MINKRVYFHVGAHKTATSLIQKYAMRSTKILAKHRFFLIDRAETIRLIKWGRMPAAAVLKMRDLINEALRNKQTQNVLVSHENTIGRPFISDRPGLYPQGPKNLKDLAKNFDKYNTSVIISIRPQADFLESYYLQSIHEGGSVPFDKWIESVDLNFLSWNPLIESARKHFGNGNVHLVDFRTLKDGQPAFLENFFSIMDVNTKLRPKYEEKHNPSISAKGLSIALAANKFLETETERSYMRRFLQNRFSNTLYPRPKLLSQEQRTRITALYQDEYDDYFPSTNTFVK